MNEDAFLTLLQDTLQREIPLTMDMPLASLPEWDSLAVMVTMTLAERRFSKKLPLKVFKTLETVENLYELLTR